MLLMVSCHISRSFLIRTQLSGVAGCCQHIRQEVSLVEAGAGVSSPGSPWSSQVDSVVGPLDVSGRTRALPPPAQGSASPWAWWAPSHQVRPGV